MNKANTTKLRLKVGKMVNFMIFFTIINGKKRYLTLLECKLNELHLVSKFHFQF